MTVESALRWDLPRLWVAGAVALLAAVALWQYRALRTRTTTRSAVLLVGLRTAALALVLLVLVGPQVVRRTFSAVRKPLAFAIDTSRSMGLRGGLATTRLERVQRFLQSEQFRRVAADYLPEYAAFSEAVVKVPPESLASLQPGGARTDLAGALSQAGVRAGAPPAALVVFTDGAHGSAATTADDGVPLVFVGVGAGERSLEVEIGDVAAPAVAFAGQPLQLRVSVRASGFSGREVPLLLQRAGQVLGSRPVTLPKDGETVDVALEWTPPAPGTYPLRVRIPLQEGELVAENNTRELSVEVVRDRIRVLLVTGSPTWNYRFLRGALKGDPSVDLVSFIILRTASDAVDVPQQELSLIPFPTQRIFMEELPNFDLLIFDNFAYQPYLPAAYVEKIRDFVNGGGALWMLGGPLSYLGGNYQASPIADLIPVRLPEAPPAGGGFREGPVNGRLTAAGRTHPFFQGIADRSAPLPPLEGYNVAGPAREGSVVLAVVPRAGGGDDPLIVLGRHGKGRVLGVLTDSLWKWAFEEIGRGRGNRAYLTFVRQALRWSVDDPRLQPVRVEAERAHVAPGETLRARIEVLGEDFLPARSPELRVTLRTPGGQTRALVAAPAGSGVFRVEAAAAEEGTYQVVAEAASRGSVYGRAATTVSASLPAEEVRAPGLNREALTALLARRRGALLELGGDADTARALHTVLAELAGPGADVREESRPLSEEPWVFLLFLGALGSEWLVRRRAGLD